MMRSVIIGVGVVLLLASVTVAVPAEAQSFSRGKAAFVRGKYVEAAKLLAPIAARGDPHALAMLGFMHENGLGAPQDYDTAAELYSRAAECGDNTAQYLLGLMYDKGHGVERDEVLAYKWLNLATATAPASKRDDYLKIRNAVASKMTLGQIRIGQWLASSWRPKR